MLRLSISLITALYLIFQTAIGICTFFSFGMLLYFLGGLFVIVLTITSVIYASLNARREGKRAFLPLALNIATIALVLLLPLRSWWNTLFLQVNHTAFEQVVALIESDQLRPNENHIAQLPLRYRYLSRCGGQVMIDRSGGTTRVFFYTYRDMFDDFAGYLYRSDSLPPQATDFQNRWYRLRSWTWLSNYGHAGISAQMHKRDPLVTHGEAYGVIGGGATMLGQPTVALCHA